MEMEAEANQIVLELDVDLLKGNGAKFPTVFVAETLPETPKLHFLSAE